MFFFFFFVASSSLFQYCTDFEIGDMYQSVHFPVTCKFIFNGSETSFVRIERNTGINFVKYSWNENKKEDFFNCFRHQFELVKDAIFNKIDVSCQDSIKMIVDLYQTYANCMRLRNYSHNREENNPWWDTQCENAKT